MAEARRVRAAEPAQQAAPALEAHVAARRRQVAALEGTAARETLSGS
jgi:hypothetical protein